MKMTDIKSLSIVDVDNKVEELRGNLFEMRIEKATSGVEKPHMKKAIQKDIARLLTHKNSLERGNK